jgi:hypothetical protein
MQFLAPSRITLSRGEEGSVRIGGASPVASLVDSRAASMHIVTVVAEQRGLGGWANGVVLDLCPLPRPLRDLDLSASVSLSDSGTAGRRH